MDLHDAFKAAVRKFYQGFELAATTKVHGKFDYGFNTLDEVHKPFKKNNTPVADIGEEFANEAAAADTEEGLL